MENIREDTCESVDTKGEADGLVKKLNQLEFGISTELWSTIMDRLKDTSTMLQAADLDLNTAVSLIQSLTDYISSLRSEFELFELKGQELTGNDVYNEKNALKLVRSTRITFHEGNKEGVRLSPRKYFRITVFLQIIDSILATMQKRFIAYSGVRDKFSFLHNIIDLPHSCLHEVCSIVRIQRIWNFH